MLAGFFVLGGCGSDSNSDRNPQLINSPSNSVAITSSNVNAIIAAAVREPLVQFSILELLVSGLEVPDGACPESGTASIDVSFSGSSGLVETGTSVDKDYANCIFPRNEFNGNIALSFTEANGDIRIDESDGRVIFIGDTNSRLELEVTEFELLNIVPLQTLRVDRATTRDFTQTLFELVDSSRGIDFSFIFNDVATEFNNFDLTLQQDLVNSRYTLAVNTVMTNSAIGGTVTIVNESATALEGSVTRIQGVPFFEAPDAGEFVVVGFDNSRLEVTVLDGDNVEIRIDSDGDGEINVFSIRSWLEIGLDLDFRIGKN